MNTKHLILAEILIFSFLRTPVYAEPEFYPQTLPDDPRQIRSETSPAWLAATGKLTTLIRINKLEQCTLSLVTDNPEKNGVIGITAGHCIDHWQQSDGSFEVGNNVVTFKTNSGTTLSRSITQVISAEISPGDYAIVKLDASISRQLIQPLINSPLDYQDLLDDQFFSLIFQPYATLAGHSSDRDMAKKATP